MPNVTTMTFVIGEQAAAAVHRQLADTAAYLKRQRLGRHDDIAGLARFFHTCLLENPTSLDLFASPMPGSDVRVIWQGGGDGAGKLFVIENGTLQTVNLLLAGMSPEADDAITSEAARASTSPA